MKTAIIIALNTLVLLFSLEAISYQILKKDNQHEFFLIRGGENLRHLEVNAYKTDIILGWTSTATNYEGYKILSNVKDHETETRILILGGSTSDQFYDQNNWPKQLYTRLKEGQYNFKIYNGAVAGYNSSQELLKLLRDIRIIRPHIVISYNGVNEVFRSTKTNHPFISNHVLDTLVNRPSYFFPNSTKYLSRKLNLSRKDKIRYGMELRLPPEQL